MSSTLQREKMTRMRQAMKLGASVNHADNFQMGKGTFLLEMKDARTGEVLVSWQKDNVITKDGGVLAAMLFQDRGGVSRGLAMLAVGSGARGSLLNPDSPHINQRKLNAELETGRKGFASVVYRDAEGGVSAVPTNVVDFTTSYGEAEAVGPLNEMGLLSPKSDDPTVKNPVDAEWPAYDATVDLTDKDILVNYLTFPVISKPSTAILTITWRLTF
mgnify:FL=1